MVSMVDIQSFGNEVLGDANPVLLAVLGAGGETANQVETLDTVSRRFQRKLKVCQVEENSLEAFKGRYHVMGTPTYLLFHKGREQERMLGVADKDSLAGFVARTLGWVEEPAKEN